MKKILVTGGTVFVSRYIAEYFVKKNYDVYVLNRNTKPQSHGVTLINADRNNLVSTLENYYFDTVIDVNAYNATDINNLLDALGGFNDYVMISSSAVYPEYLPQPFDETHEVSENKFWGAYGTNKIAAERALTERVPNAYILRPPYLYGQMNNVYREAFVFDCALQNREFYLPQEGSMKLQFLHVDDLSRFITVILDSKPTQRIFNVGNSKSVFVKDWVTLCYRAVGKTPRFVNVSEKIEQRKYFPFYNYEYCLDVTDQYTLMPRTKPLDEGLKEAYVWYLSNHEYVNKKPFIEFIDNDLKEK